MSVKRLTLKKTLAITAAGKLALSASSAFAQDRDPDKRPEGQGSKAQESNPAPPLTLNQIGYPFDLLSQPTVGLLDEEDLGNGGKAAQEYEIGTIWTDVFDENRPPRIDFIVNNIRTDRAATVFLAYGTRLAEQPFPVRSGSVELDLDDLEVVAIINLPGLNPGDRVGAPNALGRLAGNTQSVTIPVVLSRLDGPRFESGELFFQALVLPPSLDGSGGIDIAEGQASEVDHYFIERVEPGVPGSGSKGGEDGNVLTGDVPDDGDASDDGSKGSKLEEQPGAPDGGNNASGGGSKGSKG